MRKVNFSLKEVDLSLKEVDLSLKEEDFSLDVMVILERSQEHDGCIRMVPEVI